MHVTPRQKQVLTGIQRGLSNKKIAKNLNISESTVKMHVSALFKIYAVQTRQQLALFSQQGMTGKIPDDVETEPFGWVHRHGDKIIGIIFKSKQPKEGWEPIYIKGKQ